MKIVIIDGDREAGKFIKDCLMTLHFDCEIAGNERDGLKIALREDCVCVITEVVLPGRDGIHLCSEIRKERDIPIIFISSEGGDASKVRAFGAGADDYITKPFSISETVARVDRHISRYLYFSKLLEDKNQNITKIRGLEIDKNSHRVFVEGSEVIMPVKEYELLLFLAENPNMVFSKEHLLDRVWGIDAVGDSSTVTVHIQRIREKINRGGETYIETVWGAGYRMKS